MSDEEVHDFYGRPVFRDREQGIIKEILAKYRNQKADEDLKKCVWEELQQAKFERRIHIPFTVVLRRDTEGKYPPRIEVILDTRV